MKNEWMNEWMNEYDMDVQVEFIDYVFISSSSKPKKKTIEFLTYQYG